MTGEYFLYHRVMGQSCKGGRLRSEGGLFLRLSGWREDKFR